MSKSSSKRRKNRSTQSSRSPQPAKSSSSAQAAQPARKVHGAFLTGVLIFLLAHAILTAVLLLAYRKQPEVLTQPALWSLAALVTIAEIVGVAAVWYWKRWGLYLYLVATCGAIVLGFLVYPSQLVAFHGIIPLAILGYTLAGQKKMQLLT